MMMEIALFHKGEVVMIGHPADIREKVQDMFEEKYGFYPDLEQTEVEELQEGEEYYIYLHTDSYEDLSEEELDKLDELGVTETEETTTEALKKCLDIDFGFVLE